MVHIERETLKRAFKFKEVEELEGDLEKIRRWFSEVKQRDFWEVTASKEVEKSKAAVEAGPGAFIQKIYNETSKHPEDKVTST